MTRATDEVRSLRMDTGDRPRGDAVAVDVEITREPLDTLQLFRVQDFTTVGTIVVVPR